MPSHSRTTQTKKLIIRRNRFSFWLTSQISHDPGWRGACASTTRDSWGRCAVAPGSASSFSFPNVDRGCGPKQKNGQEPASVLRAKRSPNRAQPYKRYSYNRRSQPYALEYIHFRFIYLQVLGPRITQREQRDDIHQHRGKRRKRRKCEKLGAVHDLPNVTGQPRPQLARGVRKHDT